MAFTLIVHVATISVATITLFDLIFIHAKAGISIIVIFYAIAFVIFQRFMESAQNQMSCYLATCSCFM